MQSSACQVPVCVRPRSSGGEWGHQRAWSSPCLCQLPQTSSAGSRLLSPRQVHHGPHPLLAGTPLVPEGSEGLSSGARVGSLVPLCQWESRVLGCEKEPSRAFETRPETCSQTPTSWSPRSLSSAGSNGSHGLRCHPLHWAGVGTASPPSSPPLTRPQGSALVLRRSLSYPELPEPLPPREPAPPQVLVSAPAVGAP